MNSEAILLLEFPAEGVALLRINRPAVRNALNLALRREIAENSVSSARVKTCAASSSPATKRRFARAPT
jgi:enoyl-CoA hydratase/carnithine racemase